jgi:hypothetical protein
MKKIGLFLVFITLFGMALCPPVQKDIIKIKVIRFYEFLQYERELDLFAEHLGWKESRNNWEVINPINCMGAYQFHPKTLQRLGYDINPREFKKDPSIFPKELQEECLRLLIKVNLMSLKKYEHYIGTTINGIKITRSGLLAGMHLGGLGSVKVFLLTNGKSDRHDINGTRISDYIKEFSTYKI